MLSQSGGYLFQRCILTFFNEPEQIYKIRLVCQLWAQCGLSDIVWGFVCRTYFGAGFTATQETKSASGTSTDKSNKKVTPKQEWKRLKLVVRRPNNDKTHHWLVRTANGQPPSLPDDDIAAENIFASVTGLSVSRGNYYDIRVPVPEFEMVMSVMRGSAAEAAGFQSGDRLLRVESNEVRQVSARILHRALAIFIRQSAI